MTAAGMTDTSSYARFVRSSQFRQGMTLTAYPGDGSVLLAMDLTRRPTPDFAGFSIWCHPPAGDPFFLLNRLSFRTRFTALTRPAERVWTPSDQAPFQKFHWVHFRSREGDYLYRAAAMFYKPDGSLEAGPSAEVGVRMAPFSKGGVHMGFTRGYLSSQAYADEFQNAPIEPHKPSISFDTSPYRKQYEWLGFHARKMIFDFLSDAADDPETTLDVFAYDLDEPDFIHALQRMGARLRILIDDAELHTGPSSLEPKATKLLERSAGKPHVRTGHFGRFAHHKVLIMKKYGRPVRVLTGSANFSIRGLYVQANNIFTFDDPQMAALYSEAFDESFDNMRRFRHSPSASGWLEAKVKGHGPVSVSFAPHRSAEVSLNRVAEAIRNAESSVLFAVMEMGGGGPVLQELKTLAGRTDVFSYGITQRSTDLKLYKPGRSRGVVVPFGYLKDKVPAPFQKEWSGGAGQVIHHKFVVVDFNGKRPMVFSGSSNLSAGGETSNGDNLLALSDRSLASAYAVEAIRLVDHYHFRAVMRQASEAKPLSLEEKGASRPWWSSYYDPKSVKHHQRVLFSKPAR